MATSDYRIYRCARCGNVVELVHDGMGHLICCGEPMMRVEENVTDASTEKRVPRIKRRDGHYTVTVGSTPHPMDDDHYIEWVEVIADGVIVHREHLRPGDDPRVTLTLEAKQVRARAYCNLHGLWTS
jgi:superoxide reductase